jgi:phage tail protein X
MTVLTVERDGMTLDLVLWEGLGRNDDALVVATINANPGLAGRGVILPVGLSFEVPELTPARTMPTVRLWD